jgi:dipeptidyl aminopeptidase/acylaminoacyl peptidase
MKRSLMSLIVSALLLGLGWLVPHSTFDVDLETPTPLPSATLASSSSETVATNSNTPTSMPTPIEEHDPYGELYFTIIKPKEYAPPATPPPGVDESVLRLARLPGSCVVGLVVCPAPEIVPTPFDMKDVLANDSDSGALTWSPDGRYGMIVVHPPDDYTRGWTNEGWEQYKKSDLKDLQISPSTLYLFDAENDTWSEIYRADRKFFYSAYWSPDGQWIAFTVGSEMGFFHPSQADDGFYVVRADGSGLQQLGGLEGNREILGWVGNSILLRRFLNPGSFLNRGSPIDFSHIVEKLNFDGQVTTLFESSRLVNYVLAPDGGSLLAADSVTREGGGPDKTINVLALDGSVIHSFGTVENFSSSIFPFVWSPDGSQVAFANLRRLYVAPRVSQLDLPADTFGIPPDTREVYVADDTYTSPNYMDLQFSHDNKYLLIEVYEGFTHFVVVSLESGQSTPLAIPHMDPFVWDDDYLGDPSFFSWRQ